MSQKKVVGHRISKSFAKDKYHSSVLQSQTFGHLPINIWYFGCFFTSSNINQSLFLFLMMTGHHTRAAPIVHRINAIVSIPEMFKHLGKWCFYASSRCIVLLNKHYFSSVVNISSITKGWKNIRILCMNTDQW